MRAVYKRLANKEFFLLNGILLLFLTGIILNSPFRPSDDLLLFTSDSKTYFNAGKEFFDFSAQGDSLIRPFFYSCFLALSYYLGGAWLVVLLQLLFWLTSANLIYYCVKEISGKLISRIIAVFFFAINLSLISYAFHGLTEVMSVLLLSLITFITCKTLKKRFEFKTAVSILFLFALLAVTKPLFLYPFLFFLLVTGVYFFKTYRKNIKLMLLLLLAATPVLLQLTAMKAKYDILKISEIGSLTFHKYLLAQGIREIESISEVPVSQEIALHMAPSEKRHYLWNHRNTFLKLYFKNIQDNVTGYGTNIILPSGKSAPKYVKFMAVYNEKLYIFFYFLFAAFIILSIRDLFSKKLVINWQSTAIGLLLFYIIFSSGISFWQADRLIIFSLPLWIVLLFLILNRLGTTLNKSHQ